MVYRRLKSPFNVQLEVTGSCPHLCIHCYNFWREKESPIFPVQIPGALTPSETETIVQKLADAEVFNLVITGGEPLLNTPSVLAALEVARRNGMTVSMNSSLTLLTQERAEVLRDAGLGSILTSILGPTAGIHDAITQRQGSFARLKEGILCAQNAGIRVSANMVVSRMNIGHVRATAEVLNSLGVKTFCATKAGCPGNCKDFTELQLNHEQVVMFLNDMCWCRENLQMEVDTLEPIPLCGLSGVEHPEFFTGRKCSAGVTTMTVSYDGQVRPCSHLDVSYGNLFEEDLEVVWERMSPWGRREYTPSDCVSCPMLEICGAGCRMEGKSRTGTLFGLDPYADLKNIPTMSGFFGNRTQMKKTADVSKVSGFRPKRFRTRSETFGGVASVSNRNRVLLDHRGFAVILQLRPDSTYTINDPSIDWNGLDSSQFVGGLLVRGVVTPVQL